MKNMLAILAALALMLTAGAAAYRANAEAYCAELAALDAEYEAAVSKAAYRTVLFADRFPFRYLTDDYGLSYYAAFSGCSAETEASFRTIVFLAGKLDELDLPAALPAGVDLDLSRLSGTVVYSQVYNMMLEPQNYLGMVIRMAGWYSAYEDAERGIVYHACVIPDATACCAQGIEFVRGGEHVWPEDFPEEGTDIVVTGRLEAYEEDGTEYLHLTDAELTWEAGAKD